MIEHVLVDAPENHTHVTSEQMVTTSMEALLRGIAAGWPEDAWEVVNDDGWVLRVWPKTCM